MIQKDLLNDIYTYELYMTKTKSTLSMTKLIHNSYNTKMTETDMGIVIANA